MDRRSFVAGAGAGLGIALAGCLQDEPGSTPNGSGAGDGSTGGAGADARGTTGESRYEIALAGDPRLGMVTGPTESDDPQAVLSLDVTDPIVGSDEPATIDATLENVGDAPARVDSGAPWPFGVVSLEPVTDDGESRGELTLWTDAYEVGDDAHYVGTDGRRVTGVDNIGRSEDLAPNESVTRTYELHADSPNLAPGTYEGSVGAQVVDDSGETSDRLSVDARLRIEPIDSQDDGEVVTEDPRVDEPPHEIGSPRPDDDPDAAWNEDYLGDGMATDGELAFDHLTGLRPSFPALSLIEEDEEYAVRTATSEAELAATVDLDGVDDPVRDRLEAIDFDAELVVFVESGFGSGSIGHAWRRADRFDDGVHLHGHYVKPAVRTDDYTSRLSTLVVDRPPGFEYVRVSLTVSEDRRVHVNSTEGPVSVDE